MLTRTNTLAKAYSKQHPQQIEHAHQHAQSHGMCAATLSACTFGLPLPGKQESNRWFLPKQ